jgi:hypothetical protein
MPTGPQIYILELLTDGSVRRSVKSSIRKWVDAHSGIKRSSWVILYVPQCLPQGNGTVNMDAYSKIYAKLSSDFCAEKAGDRTVYLLTSTARW